MIQHPGRVKRDRSDVSTDLPREGRLLVLHRDGVRPHAWEPFVKRVKHGREVYSCQVCARNRSYPAHDGDLR